MKELKARHMAIMDAMMSYPQKTQKELAELLGWNESSLSEVVNQPLFKLAFQEYRKKFETDLRQAIVETTAAALKVSKEIIENPSEPTVNRQASIKDILALGHAKAVDKRATLSMEAEIPKEAFAALTGLMKELEQPFQPTRLLERKENDKEATEIYEAEQVIQAG